MVLEPLLKALVVAQACGQVAEDDRVPLDLVLVEVLLAEVGVLAVVEPDDEVGHERVEVGEEHVGDQLRVGAVDVGDGQIAHVRKLLGRRT
jgi:hypothetical protein